MKYTINLLIILSIMIFKVVFSQPAEEWVQRFNGPANSFDIVSKLLIDKQNNIYVYGSSNGISSSLDFTVIKYNANGTVLWVQRYDGKNNSSDQIYSACLDNSGNSYVTGFTTDTNSITNITTAKYDSSGNLIWIKVYRRAGYTNGFGQCIALDNLGNIVICGFLRDQQGTYDIVTIKYSKLGHEIWSITYNGEGNGDDFPVSLKIDNSNNIIIAGSMKTLINNIDILILKYDTASVLKWTRNINGSANSDDRVTSIALDNDDNIYLCGSMYNNISSSDYFFAKLNFAGAIQWVGNFNGIGNNIDIPSSLILDSLKNIYITGYSRQGITIGTENILTLKLNSSGTILWSANYNGLANATDQGNSIAVDNMGNIYVGGASDRGNNQFTYALLKYNSTGSLDWFKNYSASSYPEDFIYEVALDNSNNIYVTGISFDSLSDYDIATIKYSQSVSIKKFTEKVPDKFFLSQNYPNPFNPKTTINYNIAFPFNKGGQGVVSLKVFDAIGKEVATLVNEKLSATGGAGSYSITFDGSNYSSGIYFYKLIAGEYEAVKKMILLK